MSTQSIKLADKEHYASTFEKRILWNADQYFMYRNYKIGNGIKYDEAMYYSKLGSFICTDNCQLVDYIKKKLEDKLPVCKEKTKEKNYSLQKKR